MSNTFFTAISQAVTGANKRINVDIEGLSEGRIKVLLSANLGPTPENACDSEIKLRAAIAMPLLVSGTAEEVEAALYQRVRSHALAINEGAAMLEQIRSLGSKAVEEAKQSSIKAPVAVSKGEDDEADIGSGISSQTPLEGSAGGSAPPSVSQVPADNLASNF